MTIAGSGASASSGTNSQPRTTSPSLTNSTSCLISGGTGPRPGPGSVTVPGSRRTEVRSSERVHHVAVTVRDLDASLGFYHDARGSACSSEQGARAPTRSSSSSGPRRRPRWLRLRRPRSSSVARMAVSRVDHVSFTVSDLGRAVAFWEALLGYGPSSHVEYGDEQDAEVVGYPDVRMSAAYFPPPGGTLLELFQYANPASAAPPSNETYVVGNAHLGL